MAGKRATKKLRYGAIDDAGGWRFAPRFEQIGWSGDGRIAFATGKQWGFADLAGEVTVPATYDFVWPSRGGAACVEQAGTWSALGVDGKPVSGWRGSLRDGRARTCIGAWPSRQLFEPSNPAARFGFVDEAGVEVVAPIYKRAQDFSRELAMVQLADTSQFAYLDPTGGYAFAPFTAHDARGFAADGRARVKGADGFWHFMDRSGNFVIKTAFHEVSPFAEGLASVAGHDLKSPFGPMLHGFIDERGELVIERQFEGVGPFSAGLALVRRESNVGPKHGFIDRTGAAVIEPTYQYASSFCGEVAPVAIRTPKGPGAVAWGLVDRTGAWRVEPTMRSIMPFAEGRARFQREDQTWGLFDETGAVVADGFAEIAGAPFPCAVNRGGKPLVNGGVKGGKWGFLDATGREVVPCTHDAIGTGFYERTAGLGDKVAV